MLKENVFQKFFFPLQLALLILFCSACPAWSNDLVLLWDENSAPDLRGYGIYFKNLPDSEYSLYGYVTIQELTDPGKPRFVVSSLEKGKTYIFSATAYDTEGLESGFSESVCVVVGDSIAACSSADEGSGGDNGGSDGSNDGEGGGGGGCFIDSLF